MISLLFKITLFYYFRPFSLELALHSIIKIIIDTATGPNSNTFSLGPKNQTFR